MTKIVFILNGIQQVVEVGEGGGVTSDAQVLWDERIHGQVPENINLLECNHEDYEDPIFEVDGVTPVWTDQVDQNNNPIQATQTKRRLVFSQTKADANAALIASQNQQIINKQARAYLASTDWYVTRFAETNVAIPQDILDARAAARASVVE